MYDDSTYLVSVCSCLPTESDHDDPNKLSFVSCRAYVCISKTTDTNVHIHCCSEIMPNCADADHDDRQIPAQSVGKIIPSWRTVGADEIKESSRYISRSSSAFYLQKLQADLKAMQRQREQQETMHINWPPVEVDEEVGLLQQMASAVLRTLVAVCMRIAVWATYVFGLLLTAKKVALSLVQGTLKLPASLSGADSNLDSVEMDHIPASVGASSTGSSPTQENSA